METQQPLSEAQTGIAKRQVGISRSQALRELGYSQEEIDAMDTERQTEQASMGEALMAAFDKGEGSDE